MDGFDNSPLIRTAFDNEAAWVSVLEAATRVSPEGFEALLRVVDDRGNEDVTIDKLAAMDWHDAAVMFVADAKAQGDVEQALLCVDLVGDGTSNFRCIPSELWGVENNLRLANMDFLEFSEACDVDGVFRGFR